jgi:hypothetical protein
MPPVNCYSLVGIRLALSYKCLSHQGLMSVNTKHKTSSCATKFAPYDPYRSCSNCAVQQHFMSSNLILSHLTKFCVGWPNFVLADQILCCMMQSAFLYEQIGRKTSIPRSSKNAIGVCSDHVQMRQKKFSV